MTVEKPQIVLDFDGVLHSYVSGWQGIDEIPDIPVAGAKDFLTEALTHFRIAIFSQRSREAKGRIAMKMWAMHHFGEDIQMQLEFPEQKPICLVTLDDRALTFVGVFPGMQQLLNFKSWQGR